MNNRIVPLVLALILTVTFGSAVFAQNAGPEHGRPEPPMAGVHWAKGQAPPNRGGGSSPNLTSHGGSIMFTTQTTAIFWGTSWANAAFIGDKVAGLDSFYGGIGYSAYARTSDEYNDASGYVSDTITHNGHLIDTSAANVNGS